jgi:hypothetical protein
MAADIPRARVAVGRDGQMNNSISRLVTTVSAVAVVLVGFPAAAMAEEVTLNRSCQGIEEADCAVQLAPVPAASVVAVGPTTGFGPAIEFSLAATQLADAGTAVSLTRHAGASGADPSAGAATNSFNAAVGQTGTATATTGDASANQAGAQASGSSATQNPPASNTAQSGSDPSQTPPGTGGSGINMITNVASIVQIVQVVARNNSNITIAPVQVAQQCQQAAVSCTGVASGGH